MITRRSLRTLVLSGSSLLLICLAALPSTATTAIMLSDREMVIGARVILTGSVTNLYSAWDDDHRMIWTYAEIKRGRLLKGKLDETNIVLKQRGGVVGDIGVKVFGEPEFTRGQKLLLYLDTAADGTLRVAQMFMGVFEITTDRDTGRALVNRRIDAMNVSVWPRSDGQTITNSDALPSYIGRIKRIMRRESGPITEREAARNEEPLLAIPAEYERVKSQSAGYTPQYVFEGGGIRWMQADSGQPITYHINPANCPISGGAQAETARAMAAWPAQSGANIHLQAGSETSGCGFDFDGQNEISFGDCKSELPPPTGVCMGIVAATEVEYSNQSAVVSGMTFYALIETHTVFARGMDCILGNSANMAEVMCHELGHSIGFAHSLDPTALMWYLAHGNHRDATLGADDKAGALVIYPATSSGGGSGPPIISRAKIKASGKLIVIGANFTEDSEILLNGAALPQSDVNFDPGTGRLVFKGPLNVGPPGTNVLYVITSAGSSPPFVF